MSRKMYTKNDTKNVDKKCTQKNNKNDSKYVHKKCIVRKKCHKY